MTDGNYFRGILTSDKRARELAKHDGPIVGTLCNFVPEEIILAAGAVPLRLCGGDYEASKAVEDIFPRDVCGVAKSSLGLLRDGNGLFKRIDLLVVATSYDANNELSEALGRFAPVYAMLLPPAKSAPGARALWLGEVEGFRERMQELSGKPVDTSALRRGIEVLNARQEAFRRFFELRHHDPPLVTGEDALYVGGASFVDDPARWTEELDKLCDELKTRRRSAKGRGGNGLRLLLTGAPLIFPNFKLAQIVEQAGAAIVADDICSSTQRLYQPVVPSEWSMRGMLEAVAEKYLLPSV
ncbi:MAG: 2-hydroxyacyl-CoA dehydratase subunit D, partial [Armatimonadota bacterium]